MTTKSYIDEKLGEFTEWAKEKELDEWSASMAWEFMNAALQEAYSKGREDERRPLSKEDVDWFFSDESRTQKLRDAMNEEMKCHPKDKPVVMTDRIFEVIKDALQSHE